MYGCGGGLFVRANKLQSIRSFDISIDIKDL